MNESFEGFLLARSRLTERCRNFIVQLALEINCEGASRILKEIEIEYSGNSIVRLLVRCFERMPKAMQVADQFHLHENLNDAVKKALNSIIPSAFP